MRQKRKFPKLGQMDTLFGELVYNSSLFSKFSTNKKSLPKHFKRDDLLWFVGIPVRTMGDKKAVCLFGRLTE